LLLGAVPRHQENSRHTLLASASEEIETDIPDRHEDFLRVHTQKKTISYQNDYHNGTTTAPSVYASTTHPPPDKFIEFRLHFALCRFAQQSNAFSRPINTRPSFREALTLNPSRSVQKLRNAQNAWGQEVRVSRRYVIVYFGHCTEPKGVAQWVGQTKSRFPC